MSASHLPSPNEDTASLFSLKKEKRDQGVVVTSDASAPPVPPIPLKYKYGLFPQDKPLSPFDVAAQSPSSEQRPDTGRSGIGSRAVPHASSKFLPLKTPYSKESGLPRSPSQVVIPSSSSDSSTSTVRPDPKATPPTATRNFTPIMTPWSNEHGLPQPLPRAIPWPGQSRSPSPASSVRTSIFSPQSPSKESPTTTKITRKAEDTTFGVPDKELRAMFEKDPAVVRFNKMFKPGGKVSSDIVYPPGIPAAEYHKMKALYDLTGSPFIEDPKPKVKGKKPQPLPMSVSSYSLETVTPFSVHEHVVPRSAPIDPPLPFRIKPRSYKSAASSPTSPDFAKLSAAAERKLSSSLSRPKSKEARTTPTSSLRSGYTSSSLGRSTADKSPDNLKIKTKKSLRNLFSRTPPVPSLRHLPISHPTPIPPSRSASPVTVPGAVPTFSPEFWNRATLVEFPIPIRVPTPQPDALSPVPGLPAELFKFKKRAGLPPIVPQRPHDGVDLDLVKMRGKGDGGMAYVRKETDDDEEENEFPVRGAWVPTQHQAPSGVNMGIRQSNGEMWEKFSHERYSGVEKIEMGTVLEDFVLGKKKFVKDI
ncbi:hypothetical protein P171DRAFT_430673 [Karstenula rhodostoma CBS 690.94]|uniref:Uncharacterized protein n=1 Tax=Karstenula rhodostoma CBS 690.94 TaxID=1392251 RepID=A0A9P4UDV5_9PLEO|nr:hypothetical protein P171DRAFT_430673 [Karstenula rhodostoma CBS 690.94]